MSWLVSIQPQGGLYFPTPSRAVLTRPIEKHFWLCRLHAENNFFQLGAKATIGTPQQQTNCEKMKQDRHDLQFGGDPDNTIGVPTVAQFEQLLRELPWLHFHFVKPGGKYVIRGGIIHMVAQEGLATSFAYDLLLNFCMSIILIRYVCCCCVQAGVHCIFIN